MLQCASQFFDNCVFLKRPRWKLMNMMRKVVAGSLVMMGAAMGAHAYEAGDVIVRVGAANVDPNDSASTPTLNGAPLLSTDVGVDRDTQVGLTVAYMLTPSIGVELLAATPFQHDISGNGALGGVLGTTDLGSTRQLPPTLSLQYYFNNSSPVTPYLGVGVNYTVFFDEDAGSDLNTTLGGDVDLDLENSVGLAVSGGLDFDLGNNWLLNASVWYIDIDTEASYSVKTGPLAGAKVKSDVSIDPWVYMLSAGYKF